MAGFCKSGIGRKAADDRGDNQKVVKRPLCTLLAKDLLLRDKKDQVYC